MPAGHGFDDSVPIRAALRLEPVVRGTLRRIRGRAPVFVPVERGADAAGGPARIRIAEVRDDRGIGRRGAALGRELENASAYGVRLIGFLAESGQTGEVELDHTYPVRQLAELPDLLKQHVIDEVIFAVDTRRLSELEEMFLLCDEEGVKTRIAIDFFPHVNSEVYLDRLGAAPLLTFSSAPHDEIRLLVKRLTDIVLAAPR